MSNLLVILWSLHVLTTSPGKAQNTPSHRPQSSTSSEVDILKSSLPPTPSLTNLTTGFLGLTLLLPPLTSAPCRALFAVVGLECIIRPPEGDLHLIYVILETLLSGILAFTWGVMGGDGSVRGKIWTLGTTGIAGTAGYMWRMGKDKNIRTGRTELVHIEGAERDS